MSALSNCNCPVPVFPVTSPCEYVQPPEPETSPVTDSNGLTIEGTFEKGIKTMHCNGGIPEPYHKNWAEYLATVMDEYKPHFSLIKEFIEYNGMVGLAGYGIADRFHFKFSDGLRLSFSHRGWGDMMQAIVEKGEGYMQYM